MPSAARRLQLAMLTTPFPFSLYLGVAERRHGTREDVRARENLNLSAQSGTRLTTSCPLRYLELRPQEEVLFLVVGTSPTNNKGASLIYALSASTSVSVERVVHLLMQLTDNAAHDLGLYLFLELTKHLPPWAGAAALGIWLIGIVVGHVSRQPWFRDWLHRDCKTAGLNVVERRLTVRTPTVEIEAHERRVHVHGPPKDD